MMLRTRKGWLRVLVVFLVAWTCLVVANGFVSGTGIKSAFLERRGQDYLQRAPPGAIERAALNQRETASYRCLPGTIRTSRTETMQQLIPQIWEDHPPPPDPDAGRLVPTAYIETECLTYELLGAHALWSLVLLAGIALIALVGGWLARGFAASEKPTGPGEGSAALPTPPVSRRKARARRK